MFSQFSADDSFLVYKHLFECTSLYFTYLALLKLKVLVERFEVELSCRLFSLQTNLPFLLKIRHLFVTLGLAEAFRPCYEYFESSEKEHSSQSLCLGCLPLSCPACVPYVKWVFLGGKCVCFPVHISLYAYGGDRG